MVAVDRLANVAAAGVTDEALEDRLAAATTRLSEGHEDAGNDEGGQELQQSTPDAGDEAQGGFRQFANLWLHALHQRRQVRMGLRPHVVDLLADDRPGRDPGARGWNLQRIVLHVVDQLTHRIAKRTHQHRRRHDDQHDANDDQQGGRQSLLAPDLAGQELVERIERDGQDQRPDHQVQERGEDLVAQYGHGEDQAGTDQDLQQRGRQPLFEFLIKLGGCVHGSSPGVQVAGLSVWPARS